MHTPKHIRRRTQLPKSVETPLQLAKRDRDARLKADLRTAQDLIRARGEPTKAQLQAAQAEIGDQFAKFWRCWRTIAAFGLDDYMNGGISRDEWLEIRREYGIEANDWLRTGLIREARKATREGKDLRFSRAPAAASAKQSPRKKNATATPDPSGAAQRLGPTDLLDGPDIS